MRQMTLGFTDETDKCIKHLMSHYQIDNYPEIITKALAVLQTAAYIDETNGELIARKGTRESKIIIK